MRKEERKEALVQSAIFCFGKKGYHLTQVTDIIDRASVARGTFYLYFKSKKEIFDFAITSLLAQVQQVVKTLPRDAFDQIPIQLRANLERITDLLINEPAFFKLLFNESLGVDAELDERLRRFYSTILDLMRRALKQGQEMGFVREGDIRILAVGLLGAVKEVFYQYHLGTEKPGRQAIVDELFRLIVHAVAISQWIKDL